MDLESSLQDRKLGDFSLNLMKFPQLEAVLDKFQNSGFLKETEKKKQEKIHELLLSLIQETKPPCFLLAAVNEFIQLISKREWLESYTLSQFELWLNQFSGLDAEENYLVRAKIMGKYIPREAYQVLFPIGMGKVYAGSHYVTAHSSPDLDTTIASFWGWVDAFSARVGGGLHVWNVPGGPPESQIEIQFLFYSLLGPKFFDHFAKTRTSLALSAVDLITQKGMVKKTFKESAQRVEYEKNQNAVVLVDELGYYLGDWRQLDVEGVRKVTTLLNNCMRWFASFFQRKLTSLFAEEVLTKDSVVLFIQEVFSLRFVDSEPSKEFTEKQQGRMGDYLSKVLGLEKGWNSRYDEFWEGMKKLSLLEFEEFNQVLNGLPSSALFDANGVLVEKRPGIFHYLEKIVTALERAIQSLRTYVDQLGVASSIKKEVLGYPAQGISYRAEVEEVRSKMGSLPYLTVIKQDSDGRESVLGVIKASEVVKPLLGTVSLRDFCNRDETKIPSYFEVISVVDHHKTVLTTSSAPVAYIADAQSANALVAEMAFLMNDAYSTSGCSLSEVEKQFGRYQVSLNRTVDCRILQRLLQKQMVAERKQAFFVDPQREYLEYLQYLYAILDDTDLLSKVTYRDVACVASLLGRLKTLMLKQETEVVSFDDIPQDEKFAAKAARRILQNEDMYSLYKKIYKSKEEAVENSLRMCFRGEPSSIFSDTKVQNGCNRVGQTKLFVNNFPSYLEYAGEIRAVWYAEALKYYEEIKECDLHMHMVSTVPSAEDVYSGLEGHHEHKDELWFWIPLEESAIAHLKAFLDAFKTSPQIANSEMEVEFLGDSHKVLDQIFKESFMPIAKRTHSVDKKISAPVAILRYRAGLLNSRKAMISPCLPKLIS